MAEKKVPFRSLIVERSFKKRGAIQDIYTLKDSPEVIIRASIPNLYSCADPKDYWYGECLENRKVLERLRDQYGIFIPRFHTVIGGERKFYIVTQRIHGLNLYQRQFAADEMDEVKPKLSRLYSSLADVLIDTCNVGGYMIGDLVFAGARTSGNKQWVYGKRAEDLEAQPWLVDLGPACGYFPPHNSLFFATQFPSLFAMILESERKLDCRFDPVRQKLFGYMQAERFIFEDSDFRAMEIDKFFQLNERLGRI